MPRLVVSLYTVLFLLSISGLAGGAYIKEVELNNSFEEAQNLDGAFSLDADPDIYEDTISPHASVLATNGSIEDIDYYRFNVEQAYMNGFFDVDHGYEKQKVDTVMALFDSDYHLLAYNDDSAPYPNGDPGSKYDKDGIVRDSFIGVYTFIHPGIYYLAVTDWRNYEPHIGKNREDLYRPDYIWGGESINDSEPLDMNIVEGSDKNGTYTLHVSLSSPVPEPATILLLSSGLIGLAGIRKRFRV